MGSRNRVCPLKEDEKCVIEEDSLQGTCPVSNGLANSFASHFSAVEFCGQIARLDSSLSHDQSALAEESTCEGQPEPPSRVSPMEEEAKRENEQNSSQEAAHHVSNSSANGFTSQVSAVEFRGQILRVNSSMSKSALTVQNDLPARPPSSPSSYSKRRNSDFVYVEKMLKEINASAGADTSSRSRKESVPAYEPILEFSVDGTTGQNEEENRGQEPSENGEESVGGKKNKTCLPVAEEPNQALLKYFVTLSSSSDCDDKLDLGHIQSLLLEGACVNTCDRFSQTLLHEVSRNWGTDVAQFFIDKGADVNKADDFGRTPLHVAASADYSEMVRFLIDNGADIELTTKGEKQTPLHFAAKNEAPQSVKILLAYGAETEVRDYKQRTPLQLAAESNSAESAKLLLEGGATAGARDDSGMSALTLMITKMPSVALRALDQFHVTDRSHRKQRYYLNFLEQCDPDTKRQSVNLSPLQAVVEVNCFELIMHPIFQRLIEVKWGFFGLRAWLGIFLNVLLAVAYTVLGVTHPTDVANYYYPLSKSAWKIPLEAAVVLLTFNEIRKEIKEFYQSKRENKGFISWRKKEVKRDLQYCHPRWTQEKNFIKQHVKQIKHRKKTYFQDKWNYLDWVAYLMLIIVIILHVINVVVENNQYNGYFTRIHACTIIIIWVRLLKFARPFPSQGPFVVILDNILVDTIRWGFVIAMFYIPYAAAFWMLFGPGSMREPVKGYDNVGHLAFTIIRFPLVDNYNFDDLEKEYPVMSRVLCGSFLILAAIVLMNLYIALLSNTFQRVYDNARATAAMQRARLLQDLESSASDHRVERYRDHVRNRCSPEGNDFLVIISDEEEQNRKQVEKIALVHTIVSDRLGGKKFGKVRKSEFDTVLEDVDSLKRSQGEMQKSIDHLHLRLEEIGSLNSLIYEEIAKLVQHEKEQVSAITDVNTEVTSLNTNMEYKVESLSRGVESGFETVEIEAKLRNSVLEGNLGARFDQLQTELMEISSKCDEHETHIKQYEENLMARVGHLEAFVISMKDDKTMEKPKERKLSPRPKSRATSPRSSQLVDANREVVKAVATSSGRIPLDVETASVSDFPNGDTVAEKQKKRSNIMSGQAARDEFLTRLKETLTPISPPNLAPCGEDNEADKTDLDCANGDTIVEKQRKRSIIMSGQAARDDYVARLKGILAPISPPNLAPCAGESEENKGKTD
ncbi:transient receptor potential cation channel subfamily V member 3-like [Stylophora pistillata]|uniref:Transient receptor potential channel pyrexia n=1 Tax=Stylophora pistillata TaxID=50429 RepID=A0A2B4SPL0_STYPI|nr:transient receptor potential cation channel subfamily V member 3-like [Stylophora pistillata]PFX32604.1 Transient receptor potential channel pyrexia [Stylophora pistillata]